MGIKIFHTADLHLGMKFTRGYPEEVQQSLIQARFDTLRTIVEKANKEFRHRG
jgi:DNA repair exonuclease SbcCD nuclease subunit